MLCIINEVDDVIDDVFVSWSMNLVILHEYNRKTIDVSNSCIINELMMSFLVTTSLIDVILGDVILGDDVAGDVRLGVTGRSNSLIIHDCGLMSRNQLNKTTQIQR